MAGRPSGKRMLDVWMNGELVGKWTLAARASDSFAYDASWLASPSRRPISLSMPLTNGTAAITGPVVSNYFDNLLPESADIRRRIAQKFGAASTGSFDVLEKIGRDCVGSVMLLPAGSSPPEVRRIDAEPLTDLQVEKLLDGTISPAAPGETQDDELRISIAGAQEKTALLWHDGKWCRPHGATPTTHILKLPLGTVGTAQADFSTSVENEWLCSRIAAAYGLPVARSQIRKFGRYTVLVVERFDRLVQRDWIIRLPQEDFCQALGHAATNKYESMGGPGMASILDRLRGSSKALDDRRNFLAAQLLFWLLAAPDGHAKNFSIFIDRGDAFRMTPLYDVLSAWPAIGSGPNNYQWPKVKLAMAVRTANVHYRMCEIRRRHWNAVAKANALGADFEETIQDLIERTPRVIDAVSSQLPEGFPADVAGRIFEGLRQQAAVLASQEVDAAGITYI
ncbi:type II toxin-antitoxin system HipA family toxin [Noviherbaspirillum sp. ST9]|uniref:type II toxin-antitoxin system HipA family toxin n=1 Tax=Noviherbaspirillum sp. ST9 TaxID=3401606 RepID=UPI003B58B396